MAAPKPEQVTAGLAVAHLYRRFPPPEFFSAHEVVVGFTERERRHPSFAEGTERRADFLALRLWGHKVGHLLGFEVKVTRSDFLQELKDPTKREPMEAVCAACYFVAPKGIFDVSELPEGWGWLETRASGLVTRREARHRAVGTPADVYHRLMKRMLDIGWHARARRPALLDWPKEVFSFAGLAVTPGKLEALAMEVFASKVHDIELRARNAADAHWHDRWSDVQESRRDTLRAIAEVTGLTVGQLEWMKKGDLVELLRGAAAAGDGAMVGRAQDHIRAAVRQLDRTRGLLVEAAKEIGLSDLDK